MRAGKTALGIAGALTGVAAAGAVLVAPVAGADPVLDPIINAVNGDRANTRCPALNYSFVLEGAAQRYANSERVADAYPAAYSGEISPYLGSGDPQAAAINSAYRDGAGRELGQCRFTEFGVGFVRHEDRTVDVVTILLGAPKAPAPAQPAPAEPAPAQPAPAQPAPAQPAPKPAVETAVVNADVDVYGEPGGVGSPGRVLDKGTIVIVKQRRDDNWVELVDTGWVWGDFLSPR